MVLSSYDKYVDRNLCTWVLCVPTFPRRIRYFYHPANSDIVVNAGRGDNRGHMLTGRDQRKNEGTMNWLILVIRD